MTKRISLTIVCAAVAWLSVVDAVAAGGDPAAGKALFGGSGACLRCHTLELRGGGSAARDWR